MDSSEDHVKAKPPTPDGSGSSNPFTPEDIKRLQDEADCFSEEQGWKLFKTTKLAEIWKKNDDSSPVQQIKGNLFFPGIPSSAVLELITNFELRRKWEKQFSVMEVVEEHTDYRVIYWRVKTPTGASDRDFVMYITHGVDQNGMGYVLYKNATHPKRPEVPGVVRAENIFSGALIFPDKDDSNSTRVILLAQDDLKGRVPKFIVNLFYSRVPTDWRDNLDNYYHKVYKLDKSL